MSLLDSLRETGEQLVDDALPAAQELVPIVGALVAHLEQHVEKLAEVDLSKLATKDAAAAAEAAPAAPAAEAPAAEVPIASAPAESIEQLRARLQAAEAAQAQTGQGAAPAEVSTA